MGSSRGLIPWERSLDRKQAATDMVRPEDDAVDLDVLARYTRYPWLGGMVADVLAPMTSPS